MKQNIGKLVVMALVAMAALNSQSEAACVHVHQVPCKNKVQHVVKSRVCKQVHKHQHKKYRHECCRHAKRMHNCVHVVRNRKGCCRHGR